MFVIRKMFAGLMVVILMAGCATYEPSPPEREPKSPNTASGTEERGIQDTATVQSESSSSAEKETREEARELSNDAGEIDRVDVQRNGDVVTLTLDQAIVFELGKAEIKRSAWPTLDEIAKLILEYPERLVMVQGHTDDLPTRTDRYPSNWDLSAQRAVNVLKYVSNIPGLDPSRLVAAGFGEHHPRVPNDSPENRALNRRVEIVMYPSDLPEVTIPVPQP